uniref:Ribosomal protein S19 n=1 Tax=Ulmus macrocarpa TaxID=1043716 RepID=A0A8F0FPJ2_9ROSA|nr:ribosomal protein S19 [Ulmus macrocarpa]
MPRSLKKNPFVFIE